VKKVLQIMRILAIVLCFEQPFSDSLDLDCKIYNNIIDSIIYKTPSSKVDIFSKYFNRRAYLED